MHKNMGFYALRFSSFFMFCSFLLHVGVSSLSHFTQQQHHYNNNDNSNTRLIVAPDTTGGGGGPKGAVG